MSGQTRGKLALYCDFNAVKTHAPSLRTAACFGLVVAAEHSEPRSRICVRGTRGCPLSKAKAAAKSRIRARIEHVFGAQKTAPGGRIVRTIGILRARPSGGDSCSNQR